MSFTTVLAMIQSLRQNARPRRKAFEYSKDKESSLKKHYSLKYKKVSSIKLENIKSKIKLQTEKENRQIFLKIVTIGSIALIIFTIYYTNSDNANNARIVKERSERLSKQKIENEALKNMDINFFIDSGEKWIEKKDFREARHLYNLALDIDPNNYSANIGLVNAYILDCLYNDSNCYNSEYLLKKTIGKFGNTKELNELQTKLERTIQAKEK